MGQNGRIALDGSSSDKHRRGADRPVAGGAEVLWRLLLWSLPDEQVVVDVLPR